MQDTVIAAGPVDEEFSALLGQARSGDSDAATDLVRRYEPELRRYVRFRLTDSRLRRFVDSVDICQSILGRFFVGFFAGKYELRSPDELIALLFRMAKNEVCDQIRKQRAARRGGPERKLEPIMGLHGNLRECRPRHGFGMRHVAIGSREHEPVLKVPCQDDRQKPCGHGHASGPSCDGCRCAHGALL